jgi:two-component system invasion response regulator UvrY
MKLIIVDDNKQFRSTIRLFVRENLNHTVIAEAESGEDFLKIDPVVIREADIILMDIMMNRLNGFETTKQITWLYPNLKIIAVTMHIEKVFLKEVIESGFKGCVFKSDIFDSLEYALKEVTSGHIYINKQLLA